MYVGASTLKIATNGISGKKRVTAFLRAQTIFSRASCAHVGIRISRASSQIDMHDFVSRLAAHFAPRNDTRQSKRREARGRRFERIASSSLRLRETQRVCHNNFLAKRYKRRSTDGDIPKVKEVEAGRRKYSAGLRR